MSREVFTSLQAKVTVLPHARSAKAHLLMTDRPTWLLATALWTSG
jgi:hypothetical protein